jgi:hypothetical protein
MAGAGYKLFATGDVLTAAQVNTFLMQQTVMVFADSAARTTALSGVLAEGMVSYLQDTNSLEVYDGSGWVGATGDITALTAGTGITITSNTGPIPTVAIDTAVTADLTTAQTLTNKTLTTPVISSITNTGTLTLPTSTDTLVGRATTDTLTNKTLTSPVLTTPTISTIDAKGDLLAGTADNTIGRLAIGTNGQVLTADSDETTGMKWATPSAGASFVGCSLYDTNATQSISNNTSTLVTWNSENFDTNTFHSTSTNTSRITIPSGKAGYYLFTSYGFFGDNATGNRRLDLRKNGSLIRSWPTPSTTATFSGLTITCLLSLAEADYIEIAVFQTSGGALSYYKGIDTGNQYGSFECQYLGV